MGTHEAQGRAPHYTACTRCEANKAIPRHTHGKQTHNFRYNCLKFQPGVMAYSCDSGGWGRRVLHALSLPEIQRVVGQPR